MFFEVCLLSFGLFAGSELCKKIKQTARKEPYPPIRLKKRHNKKFEKRPSDKISIRRSAETAEIKKISAIDGDYAEFRAALETLTKEVSLLRKEIAKLQKTETEITAKMIQPVTNY